MADLVVPVHAGLDGARVVDALELNEPDAEVEAWAPRLERHCSSSQTN